MAGVAAKRVARMNDLESRAWLSLVKTAQLLPAVLDAHLLETSGLTEFEYVTLSMLNQAEDRVMRATRLAEATNSKLPRLSKVITKLQARGLVQKVSCPSDGRAVNVQLTQTGRRAMMLATPGHIEQARDLVIDRLSDDQLQQLVELLEPIITRLDPHGRFSPLLAEPEEGVSAS